MPCRRQAALVDGFNAEGDHHLVVAVTNCAARHVFDGALPFDAQTVLRRVGAEGILNGRIKSGKDGRRVGDGVVNVVVTERNHLEDAADFTPTAGERAHRATEAGVRAVAADNRTHAAEGEVPEVAVEVEARVAPEEAAALAEITRVGRVAVFKHEPHFEAVAEVFFALTAEARAFGLTGNHAVLRRIGAVGVFAVLHGETQVENAVEFDVGGRRGGRKRGERSRMKKGLFHVVLLGMRVEIGS